LRVLARTEGIKDEEAKGGENNVGVAGKVDG
jgi:hypothetical protein